MARLSSQSALTDELERFQQLVQSMAIELTRAIVRVELQSRIDDLRASLHARAPARRRSPKKTPKRTAQNLVVVAPVRDETTPASTSKLKWTRDSIITELASWLASGTTIDASFVTRHGPRGLVAASRREFGRFEAALNVASLRVAQLYPDKTVAP